MLATMEIVDILDSAEGLGKSILESETMEEYHRLKQVVDQDPEAQKLIQHFNKMKEAYEEVERFGRYHPDYNQIMKDIRAAKREMDMHESIAQYKVAETSLQKFLDEISQLVAFSVSENVKVPLDGAALTDSGCSCGSGGGCGCQAS